MLEVGAGNYGGPAIMYQSPSLRVEFPARRILDDPRPIRGKGNA